MPRSDSTVGKPEPIQLPTASPATVLAQLFRWSVHEGVRGPDVTSCIARPSGAGRQVLDTVTCVTSGVLGFGCVFEVCEPVGAMVKMTTMMLLMMMMMMLVIVMAMVMVLVMIMMVTTML
eukprot:3736998-Pyramimonas_sp.AAC.1